MDLTTQVDLSRWQRHDWPFPHIIAQDVFPPAIYAACAAAVQRLLALGLSESPRGGRFARGMQNYDAYGVGFHAGSDVCLRGFLTPAWRDLMAGLFAITPTPYMFAGAHYHRPQSLSGFLHNDCNPVWFPRAPDDVIQIPDERQCAYKTGRGMLPAPATICVVRGVVLIYYLCNDGWQPGDGGETGLYSDGVQPVERPEKRMPPINNSLIAYECTPHSWHSFIHNRRGARTSLIMWVHRPYAEAVARFGEEGLEQWR